MSDTDQVTFEISKFLNQSDFPVQFTCSFADKNNNKIKLNFKILDGFRTKPLSDSPGFYDLNDSGNLKEATIGINQVYIIKVSNARLNFLIYFQENSIL